MENIVRPIDRDRAKLQEMRRSDPPMEAEKQKDGKLPKKTMQCLPVPLLRPQVFIL